MAMDGSWPSISEIGLQNTTNLLDKFEVSEADRAELLTKRRPASVPIQHAEFGEAVVRDQIPLLDNDLENCLLDGLTPLDWHKRLNERVFFWTNPTRLTTLLSARAYRDQAHHVLEVDTRSLVEAYYDAIELTPMNSGCTRPWKHPRGKDTFLPIDQYPYQKRLKGRRKDDAVVELTVIGGVPDIKNFTIRVSRMQKGSVLEQLYPHV
jgi:hypothetical protein